MTDGAIISIKPSADANLSDDRKTFSRLQCWHAHRVFSHVHPKVPAATISEFIAYARARPGQFNYGSSGVGSTHHLSMEAMNSSLKLVMTYVPFKGTGELVPALLGGHIDVLFSVLSLTDRCRDSNQLRLLATNGAKRSAQATNLPSLSEFVPGFDFAPVIGIFGRSGMASAVVQKIAAEALAAVKEPDLTRQLAVVGVEPAGTGSEYFAAVLQAESGRVAEVVRAAGIKAK